MFTTIMLAALLCVEPTVIYEGATIDETEYVMPTADEWRAVMAELHDLRYRVGVLEDIARRCQCVEVSDDRPSGDYLHPRETGIGCITNGGPGELTCTGTRGIDLWCECKPKEE